MTVDAGGHGAAIWDGRAFLAAFAAATNWLTSHGDQVNALNVFPVPDGDTGTNMSLTLRAALAQAETLDGPTRGHAGTVAASLADGALMGARGNSGVILSQILRGAALALANQRDLDGRALAAALARGSELAYQAVLHPVEGTMLTVIRVAAEYAARIGRDTPVLAAVLPAAVQGAREALAATPDQLPILAEAGVVDAGGRGLVLMLEGLEHYLRDLPTTVEVTPFDGHLGAEMAFLDRVAELHGDAAFGYCTNFMVAGQGIDVAQARADLAALGESAVVVGDERLLRVHLHTFHPGSALEYAVQLGDVSEIKIENMQIQTRALQAQRLSALEQKQKLLPLPPPLPVTAEPVGDQAVLAVASGEGLIAALLGMGVTRVIAGGQTMNPSVEELLAAVNAAPVDDVILLPNHGNILLTAGRIPELTSKRVRVVPSRSVPQALAALEAYHVGADIATNVRQMTAALGRVRTVELTRASREAALNGIAVAAGQVIGLVDGAIVASGEDLIAVAAAALGHARLDRAELVTIFAGQGAEPSATSALRDHIAATYPDVEVQVYDGGQPIHLYVLAVE